MAAALLGQAPEATSPTVGHPSGAVGGTPVQLKAEGSESTPGISTTSSANQTTASTAQPDHRDEIWQHVIGEASETVGKLGRVDAPLGVRLRKTPDPAGETIVILPFDTLVHVERKTQHGWCYVVALGDARGVGSVTGAGFVEADHVALDPPDPKAHLHWVVESGLQPIAEQHYDTDDWGSDARLYVEAIWMANQGRRGITRNLAKLSGDDTKPGTVAHTQAIWNSVEVRPDHAIWIPSPEFVEALRSQGAISSGSLSYEAWEGAKAVASEFVDWAKYGAGFVVGVLEGAYGAVRDLVMGVAELFDMVYSIAKALVTEGLDALRQFGSTLYEAFKNAPELLQQLGADFAVKWNDPNAYDRGGFHGEVVGYVLMQALILVLTLGSAASIQLGGRFAKVVQVVRTLDAAADPLVYASKLKHLAKLPSDAITKLRKVLGKAGEAGDAVIPGTGAATRAGNQAGDMVDTGTASKGKPQERGAGKAVQDPNAALEGRLRGHGIDPDRIQRLDGAFRTAGIDTSALSTLPDDALVKLADPKVLGEVEAIARLQQSGRVIGLLDWIQFGAAKTVSDLGRVTGELREARRLVDENPGSVLNIGGDARAPVDAATGNPLRSFDLTVETPTGQVTRSIEVTTVDIPVSKPDQITNGVRHATDKVMSRQAAGHPIPGHHDVTIRMQLAQSRRVGGRNLTIDNLGNIKLETGNGRSIPKGNLFDGIASHLASIPSHQYLDRVTLVDEASGALFAEIERTGATWARTH